MSKNIIFIVNIKDQHISTRSTPYQFSVDSWNIWAKKNNCEVVVLEERIYPKEVMNANWHKLFVFDLLEANDIEYDQVMVVDADTIIHPNAPNVFEQTEHKFCAVHNEGSYDWICRSMENYSKHLFDGYIFPIWEYINSGVLIMNKDHKQFYKKIVDYYLANVDNILTLQKTYGVGTDQPVINFFMHMERIDFKLLPYEWNMQAMNKKEILGDDMLFTKLGWIYHYNGIPGGDESTYIWMKKTDDYFKQLKY
tara:strand:+ start:5855 stop:6610 length:756 start_codon:yes stop_codon:yes gene_type:complete